MPTTEWNTIPFDLLTPLGTLPFNQGFPGFWMVENACKASRPIRVTTDPIPQADGDILHERFTGGYEMKIVCQAWESEDKVMCSGETALVDLRDELYKHLWALLRPAEDDQCRIIWTPTGHDRRMLNAIRILDIADPSIDDLGLVTFEFTVDTRFPYAISLLQTLVNLNGTGDIVNAGNVEFWPVIKVFAGGAGCGQFTIEHVNGLKIVFDSSYNGRAIAAGAYAEIDTFKATIFENGDGADLSGALVATETDFFPILPGTNSVSAIGGGGFNSATFLMNDAFA